MVVNIPCVAAYNRSYGGPIVSREAPPSYAAATGELPTAPSGNQHRSIYDIGTSQPPPQHAARAIVNESANLLSVDIRSSLGPDVRITVTDTPRNATLSSERRPLLPQSHDIRVAYNSVHFPSRVRVTGHPSHTVPPLPATHSSYTAMPRPEAYYRRLPSAEEEQRTAWPVIFLALVMFGCITWVILLAIFLPCTEATC